MRGVGEPSFSVRQRAFKKEGVEEQEKLPMDEGLPPGVTPKSRKKELRAKEASAKKKGSRDAKDTRTMGCIDRTATEVHETILKGEKPDLRMPVRALSNVKYKEKVGFFELGRQKKKVAVLAPAFDVLQNRKFQICNKSPHPLNIAWVSAAYSDGRQLKLFDSARCESWRDLEVASGENRSLLLSSTDESCNWNGNVIYYAIRFSKETEDSSLPYSMAGVYRGFDRDCFTVQ